MYRGFIYFVMADENAPQIVLAPANRGGRSVVLNLDIMARARAGDPASPAVRVRVPISRIHNALLCSSAAIDLLCPRVAPIFTQFVPSFFNTNGHSQRNATLLGLLRALRVAAAIDQPAILAVDDARGQLRAFAGAAADMMHVRDVLATFESEERGGQFSRARSTPRAPPAAREAPAQAPAPAAQAAPAARVIRPARARSARGGDRATAKKRQREQKSAPKRRSQRRRAEPEVSALDLLTQSAEGIEAVSQVFGNGV
jgi:hypothetical protein